MKKKHHESREKWEDELETYRNEGSTKRQKSYNELTHWTVFEKSITNYMTIQSCRTEQAVFSYVCKHENKCVAMNKFEMLKTADIHRLYCWSAGKEDPMTRHMMQYFIHIFQGDTILQRNDCSIEWASNTSGPDVQISTSLTNRYRKKKQFYVGIDADQTWYAYELNYRKFDKNGTVMFKYFDFKHGYDSNFDSIKKKVIAVWTELGYVDSKLSCSGNDLTYLGSNTQDTTKETSAEINSLYVVYYVINRIGGMDTEVHDKTISDLRYHFILGLLTGEPFYNIMYGSLEN